MFLFNRFYQLFFLNLVGFKSINEDKIKNLN